MAAEFQEQPLLRGGLERIRFRTDAVIKVADLDAECIGKGVEPAAGDPVDALLVLVGLLVGHADQLGQTLLGQAQHDPALAQLGADMAVGLLRSWAMSRAARLQFRQSHDAPLFSRARSNLARLSTLPPQQAASRDYRRLAVPS